MGCTSFRSTEAQHGGLLGSPEIGCRGAMPLDLVCGLLEPGHALNVPGTRRPSVANRLVECLPQLRSVRLVEHTGGAAVGAEQQHGAVPYPMALGEGRAVGHL